MLEETKTDDQKKCGACGVFREKSLFHRDKSRKDGLFRICKECSRMRAPRVWKKRPAEARRHNVKEYEEKNKNKVLAWKKLNQAIRTGSVVRWPVCALPECDSTRVQAHHADYSRPLDVIWLCQPHHKQIHRRAF